MARAVDDEEPDQFEYDPRWEVQPEPEPDDVPGGNMRAVLVAAATTVIVLILAWLLANGPPPF